MAQPLEHLRSIFTAGLERIDPYRMIVNHVRVEGSRLVAAFEGQRHEVDLDAFERILVLGAGKASARMARAFEDILGQRVGQGLVVVKYGHGEPLERVEVLESAHPTPDENGVAAARRVAELAAGADERTLVINLVSGGGSALLPCPLGPAELGPGRGLTLEHKQAMTRALLACGAEIGEINCIRKHISAVKGGRLLRLLAPATSLNFILSDVVGDRLDTIASGLTSHDDTTFGDALGIVDKYGLADLAPPEVLDVLRQGAQGAIAETPKAGDPATALATNILIGSNHAALVAAAAQARALGYNVAALTCGLTGESREAAKFFYGIARDVRKNGLLLPRPACIIAGGETVVNLKGQGKGGRNQEMALAFLAELARDDEQGADIWFLSASTDGTDGPTDAAGAFAATPLLHAARARGLSWDAYLRDNDSYHFFEAIGGLLKTGPTMTNVCDLHMVLVV